MATRYFTPQLFAFLKDLAENNDREWFKAHQDLYEHHVREPALEFINDFARPLERISTYMVADSRKVGGSLFRIQRDTRFAKDKTPYKTNTGMQFRHLMAKDVHTPGFYAHFEPRGSFVGVGIWRPETKAAYQIRDAIAENPGEWKKATRSKRFTDVFELDGDRLQRVPKGYDPESPYADDLRFKDFIAVTRITQKRVTGDGFMEDFTDLCRRSAPMMRFLCDAMAIPF